MKKKQENVEIRVFASAEGQKYSDTQNEERIADAIRNHVLPSTKLEYRSVKVKVKRKEDGSPDYLIAYMLRKDTYTADVIKVDVDGDFQVKAIEEDYDDSYDDD